MLLATPVPPREALAALARRDIMPTNLGTYDLQQLGRDVQLDSFFSARTTLTDLLNGYKGDIGKMLNPQQIIRDGQPVNVGLTQAYALQDIQQLLQKIGYQPNPEDRGTIKDLSSDGRINLVLETNVQIHQGEGWWLQGQNDAVLDEFPAQELFRAESRLTQRNWLARFRLAGAQTGDPIGTGWTITPDGRMIALKNHAIWNWLGSSKLFSDGLNLPFAPFAFRSGMNLRDIDRDETESLGLIKPGQTIQPMTLTDLREAA
jgi:hypothetical protein